MDEMILEINYEWFDHQVKNLVEMSRVLATELDFCTTQELTFDIMSLQTKATRLCYMADIDYAVEQSEITHERRMRNIDYQGMFEELMNGCVSPMMFRIIDKVRMTNEFSGQKLQASPVKLSVFITHLKGLMEMEGVNEGDWQNMLNGIAEMEKVYADDIKPTVMSGMKHMERLWRLLQYYAMMSYLLYHFRRMSNLCSKELVPEDMCRLLTAVIQRYSQSEEGSRALELYCEKLIYKNPNIPYDEDAIVGAQKALLDDVPEPLQLCFMKHINNIEAVSEDLCREHYSADDVTAFIVVIAKWQMLAQMKEQLACPDERCMIYNEVFHTQVNGRRVDFVDLKERIGRMVKSVKRKNHWICVWAILKHHNQLNTIQFEAFARQMMHSDWFGDISPELRITGDNLREYNGYFTMYDYTIWNDKAYKAYRERYNKNKWSEGLCDKFMRICCEMEDAYCEK